MTFSLVCRILFTAVVGSIWVVEGHGPIWPTEVQKMLLHIYISTPD